MARAVWMGVALALAGCLAPTIPLPPPEAPEAWLGSREGTVRLESDGGALPDAIVIVFNNNPAIPSNDRVAGAQADKTGSWSVEIRANPGDLLQISQDVDNTRSDTLNFVVPQTLR